MKKSCKSTFEKLAISGPIFWWAKRLEPRLELWVQAALSLHASQIILFRSIVGHLIKSLFHSHLINYIY